MACDSNSGGGGGDSITNTKQITLTIEDSLGDEKSSLAGAAIDLRVTSELPEDLNLSSIKWYIDYIDKPVQIGSGKTVTFTPDEGINLRYKIYAELSSNAYKGKSNVLPIYVATKAEFIDYVKKIYEHVDLTNYKPGISVSIYGKDASGNTIEFNLYDGLAQSYPNNVRNTAETEHIIGSISKSFTAASIINAYCSTAADYSAAIDILKSTKVGTEINPVTEAYYAEVNRNASLHQVLTHTSGMGDFIGVDLVGDLLSKKFGSLIIRQTLGVENPSYKFNNWEPEKILQYIIHTDNNFDSTPTEGFNTKYSTPCYDLLGIIVQNKTSTALNSYISTNFLTPLSLTAIKVAPQDITDSSYYKTLANPHIFRDEIGTLISHHTDLTLGGKSVEDIVHALETIGVLPRKDFYDFSEVVSDVNEIFSKTSWCGGALIATSDLIAKWSFNISCKDFNQSGISKIVHDTIRYSVIGAGASGNDLETSKYGYGVIHLKTKSGYDFIAHYGETVGAVNLMAYNDDTNMSYVVFSDSLQVDNPTQSGIGINPADLIDDLCAIDKAKISN